MRTLEDDGAHSSGDRLVELLAAEEAGGEPEPEPEGSLTAFVTSRVSVERTTSSECLRVATKRPSGLGLQ